MKKITGITFFFLLTGFFVLAQPMRTVPLDLVIETAQEREALGDYYNAIEWYDKAYKLEKNKDIAVRVANLYYQLRHYKSSENWLKRFLSRDEDNIYIEERYLYGKVLKSMGKFKESAEQFAQYLEFSTDEEKKKLVQVELKGMQSAKNYEDNIETVIEYGGNEINTAFTEYSPKLYLDGILYFAAIPSKKLIETDGFNEDQFSRIYTSIVDEEGNYGPPTALDDNINRPGYHTGNPCFSKDGRRMYFTRALLEGNDLAESAIYVSYKNDTGWSPAVELQGINNDNYIVKQPAVGEIFGNEVLFFISDMDGGYGNFDLYYSTRKGDAEFAAPVNVGASINTTQNEETPFFLDGVLYYSTDGKPGLGGFDIFKTTWDGTKWSDPKNMGFGYNSTYDDLYFSFDQNGENGFLISNRPDEDKKKLKSETCCDDIYKFNIRQIVIDLIATVESPDGPLEGAKVTLYDLSGAKSPETKDGDIIGGSDFQFLLDQDKSYQVIATKEGFYPDTVDFNTAGLLDDFTFKKKFTLEPIPAEPTTPIAPEIEIITINQAIRLNNIYYDFDDWKILPDAEQDLNTINNLMNKYTDMVIELSSHTDSQGVSTYNEKLSQKRAESAKQYIVNKGIDPNRIKAVGYGESIILNRCSNGVRCSDDEHRYNRRTEFKIIAGPQTIEIEKKN